MVYFITYDLNKAGKNYDGVYKAIKSAGDLAWCHFWESSWLIRSSLQSANDVFAKIKPHLDSDDTCFVVEVKNNRQGWLSKKQWDYINKNIFE